MGILCLVGVWYVSVYCLLTVFSKWVVSSIGLSLARTSFCFREGLFLYAIMGGSGKIEFSVSLVLINFQCFFIICLSLFASSQNCVTKTNFFLLSLDLGVCLDMSCCLLLNWTDSMWGKICLYLYPLCKVGLLTSVSYF